MPSVGFLHTAPVHVATFDELVRSLAPGWSPVAVVEEDLLEAARQRGVDDQELSTEVASVLDRLASQQPAVTICTCSTIGGLSEQIGAARGMRVVRVDRPMAEAAVHCGRRIAVVAAVESTIAPTRDLLAAVAADAGRSREVSVHLIQGAWPRFETGDHEGYLATIAAAMPELASGCDVIVLAQASMAAAAERVDVGVPVLSSPGVAIERLLRDVAVGWRR
jgi:hypothetical protein